jgi:hypothetical protein
VEPVRRRLRVRDRRGEAVTGARVGAWPAPSGTPGGRVPARALRLSARALPLQGPCSPQLNPCYFFLFMWIVFWWSHRAVIYVMRSNKKKSPRESCTSCYAVAPGPPGGVQAHAAQGWLARAAAEPASCSRAARRW